MRAVVFYRFFFLLLIQLVCLVTASPAQVQVIYGPVTNSANSHIYYLLSPSTWTDAEAEAISLGGRLATINDAEENSWVYSNFAGFGGTNTHLWIGFTWLYAEFAWSSGEPVTFTHWAAGEPNNYHGSDHYVYIFATSDEPATWNDNQNQSMDGQPIRGVVEVVPPLPPVILRQPADQSAAPFELVKFDVYATGGPLPLSYQWRLNGTNIFAATNSSLVLSEVHLDNVGDYSVIVTNSLGAVMSSNAVLVLVSNDVEVIGGPITNSVNGHVYSLLSPSTWSRAEARAKELGGHLATIRNRDENRWIFDTFSYFAGQTRYLWIGLSDHVEEGVFVWANGEPFAEGYWDYFQPDLDDYAVLGFVHFGLGPEWQVFPNREPEDFAFYYPACGVVEIIPDLPPQFDSQPLDQHVYEYEKVTFKVTASGSWPWTFQWLFNGMEIGGATNASLTLAHARLTDVGTYSVIVSNAFGAIRSSDAQLTVVSNNLAVILGPITNSANGHVYCLYDQSMWTIAEARAVSMGGHLVSINDQAENIWIYTNFSRLGELAIPFWIGFSDQAKEGSFIWSRGDAVTFTGWAPDEPNNYAGGEDFAYIPAGSSGAWNDYHNVQAGIYGVAEFIPSPSLNIAVSTNVVLSWPKLPEGFTLQASTNLLDFWTDLVVSQQTNGETIFVVQPLTTQPKFFRLRHP